MLLLLEVTHSCQADSRAVAVSANQPSIPGALYMDLASAFAKEEASWVSEESLVWEVWAEGQEASHTYT